MVDPSMVEGSANLRGILVELLFHIIVELVEVDGFGTEDEVVEGGNADVRVH